MADLERLEVKCGQNLGQGSHLRIGLGKVQFKITMVLNSWSLWDGAQKPTPDTEVWICGQLRVGTENQEADVTSAS